MKCIHIYTHACVLSCFSHIQLFATLKTVACHIYTHIYVCAYIYIYIYIHLYIKSVQLHSCIRLFVTPWTAACQASSSITNSQTLLKPMSIELVTPSTISSSAISFSSCLQSCPASGASPMSQFFALSGQSSASASVLPMNTQD